MSSLASGQETWYVFLHPQMFVPTLLFFVAISSQKGQLEMKICKKKILGRFSAAKSRPEFKQHRQIYSKQWFKSAFFFAGYI